MAPCVRVLLSVLLLANAASYKNDPMPCNWCDFLNHPEVMQKATNLSQIIELTSSLCLLVLVSYTVVLAQNDITTNLSIGSRDTSSVITTWTTPTNSSNYRYSI